MRPAMTPCKKAASVTETYRSTKMLEDVTRSAVSVQSVRESLGEEELELEGWQPIDLVDQITSSTESQYLSDAPVDSHLSDHSSIQSGNQWCC